MDRGVVERGFQCPLWFALGGAKVVEVVEVAVSHLSFFLIPFLNLGRADDQRPWRRQLAAPTLIGIPIVTEVRGCTISNIFECSNLKVRTMV